MWCNMSAAAGTKFREKHSELHKRPRSKLTVTSMQWRSLWSSWFLLASTEPSSCCSLWTPDTRRMVMPLSQQKACRRVKWICSATSSSSSAARTQRTTLSGSLRTEKEHEKMSRWPDADSHMSKIRLNDVNHYTESISSTFSTGDYSRHCLGRFQNKYLRIEKFGWLIDADGETVLFQSCNQQLLQSQTDWLRPVGVRTWTQWTPSIFFYAIKHSEEHCWINSDKRMRKKKEFVLHVRGWG